MITYINFCQQLKKGGLWEGVVQEPLRRALFCVFLCSEVIFCCKSHRNFFQKLPLQCRHFLENPLAKNPKTQLLILFSELISRKITFQFQDIFRELISQKLHITEFVCDSENYMEKCFGNYFLGKSHFSYMFFLFLQ